MTPFPTTPQRPESTEHPTCLDCRSPMWITRIGTDIDKRVFECPVCDISEAFVMNIE